MSDQPVTASTAPRRVERQLLTMAMAVVLVAGLLLLFAIPDDPWPVALSPLLVLAGLVAGVHAMIRLLAPDADPLILPLLVLLNGLGLVLIRRIDLARAPRSPSANWSGRHWAWCASSPRLRSCATTPR